jgi:hypothetical protein
VSPASKWSYSDRSGTRVPTKTGVPPSISGSLWTNLLTGVTVACCQVYACGRTGLLLGVATEREEASPPWCHRLISEFNAADERATALAKGLTPHQLAWAPGPGQWGIGQCLEHLCIANDKYLPAIASALAGPQSTVVQEIAPGWFGRWFISTYIEPSTKTRRARAPKAITPGSQSDPAILDRFLGSNGKAREIVHRAKACDVNRIRFRNPFVPVIRFTVGTGFEILSKHQRRHLLQAERVRQAANFPA